MNDPGNVVKGGRRGGRTRSAETTFVDQAERRVREIGKVYAVVGPDSSPEFVVRLEEVCPVVLDESAKGVCLLIDGEPSEWLGDRRGP